MSKRDDLEHPFDDLAALRKDLSQRAKTISRADRKIMIEGMKETELHDYLRELYKSMQPDYPVEVTHGVDELGKDLVIVKKDSMTTDVIGVVVKRGSLMASTLGDVDEVVGAVNDILKSKPNRKFREIQSQINQAFAHPAEIKTRFKEVPVNRVFVVLAGDISARGRRRLSKEANGPVDIFDIDWLIDNFTEYYPEIFFEGKVTDFLQSKIQELETKSWHVKQNQNLSDCFVEPLVRSVDVPLAIDNASIATAMVTRRLPFSKLKSIILSKQQVVLVGDAGTGKSAALAKLSIEMLKDAYTCVTKKSKAAQCADVSILIVAKDFLTIASVEDLLLFYFGDRQIFERLTVKVLMVDALDEVPASLREEVMNKAREYAKDLDCALILTSRKIDIVSATPAGFKKYELLPFEASQALKLFEKLHGKDQLLESLKGELNKIRYQIPMVPLSLILLMELVEENKEVPASITELYERFTDIILGRYDKKKGIEVLFEYTVKKRFLAALAYRKFLSQGRMEISREDYIAFLDDYASEYSLDAEYLSSFIREIERAGILRLDEDEVSFGHRSFLDYFAAYYVYDRRDEINNMDQFLVERYFDDLWGDTIFFYVGHKKEISEKLLDKLFTFSDSKAPRLEVDISKFYVGRLLQAGWHSPTKVKTSGIEKAFNLIPDLRQELLDFSEENKWRLPKIFADYIILLLSDHSFRSTFLWKEVKTVFEKIYSENGNILALLPLLWALKPFTPRTEFNDTVNKVLEAITSHKQLNAEEKARALIMLKFLDQSDKAMSKTIQKRVDQLQNKNPGILKKLLPERTRGSMPNSKKRSR
ncbi:MAG: hypothetical protein QOC96_2338 [Acidobacteriota bacterium]|jgi:hypothetical protein|nr:hypothetical protein [Acidobacteriota bacterium]